MKGGGGTRGQNAVNDEGMVKNEGVKSENEERW